MAKEETANLAMILVLVGIVLFVVYQVKDQLLNLFGYGGAGSNVIQDSLTGSVTPAEKSSLISEEQRAIIVAGGNSSDAQSQSTADVNAAISGQPTSYGKALFTAITSPFETFDSIFS